MSRTVADALYECPRCGKSTVKVVDSRPLEKVAEPIIQRRRVCKSCAHRWSTFEITEVAYAAIRQNIEIMQKMLPPYTRQQRTQNGTAGVAPAIEEAAQ